MRAWPDACAVASGRSAGLFHLTRIGIGKEQLLALDLVRPNGILALGRQNPIDEGLAQILFDAWMFLRIDEDDPVLVEEPLVALHHDRMISLVFKGDPGATIGQYVSVHGVRGVKRRPHSLADLAIPSRL